MPNAFAVALIVALTASPGAAQQSSQDVSPTTRLVPFSGILADAAGTPLTGAQAVTFTLFDAADAGSPLWTETQTVMADGRGRFTAHLGASVALPLEIFRTEQARWLELSVNGLAQPRVMLVAVPYALKAADAETLGGTPASAFVVTNPEGKLQTAAGVDLSGPTVDGTGVTNQLAKFIGATTLSSSVITESATNAIGIGTTDPSEGGQVDSKMTIRSADGNTALAISNQAGTPRFALNTNADGSWVTYDRATGSYAPGIAQRGGRVGIATTDPTGGGVVDAKFTVRNLDNNTGIAVLNEANGRRFALNTLANGGWMMYDGANSAWHSGLTQLDGRALLGTAVQETGAFLLGRLLVRQALGEHGIVVRKPTADTFAAAIHARSDVNISGVLIKAIAGVGDSTDSGGNMAIFGRNETANGIGVRGRADVATGIGVQGTGGLYAGQFSGDVQVTGNLTKGGGAFQIDHPLDPANRYLLHSFVESPDMMNVYNGNVVLDAQGEATVTLPDWFEALNRDFRYQLTAIGAPGPNLYIAQKISGNQFKIAGGTAFGEVSWQVTGIRQDAWANANRIPVEKDKPESERGRYLHPEAHGLSREMGIEPADVTVVTKKEQGR